MRRVWVAAIACAMLAGCGPQKPRVDLRALAIADLARADDRLLAGCYACLIDARDIYAGLLTGPAAALAATRQFEADLLIVLREQELTIDTTKSMARLEADGAGLPAEYGVPRILKRLSSLLPFATGLSDAGYVDFIKAHRDEGATADDDLRWLAQTPLFAPVRDYVALSIRCNPIYRASDAPASTTETPPPDADPPLLAYRRATCIGAKGFDALRALYELHPDLAEAAFFVALNAPQGNGPTGEKRTLAKAAYAVFPQSPAVTYAMAVITHSAGSCRDALPYYNETLALQTRHESAQLGRTTCLSVLGRSDEAIEAATQLIGWQSTKQLEAYYWRAHNERVQQHLDRARADIDESKRRGRTQENLTLAGVIEYEQGDLAPALEDLGLAWTLSSERNCTAAWYQGLVHVKREAWTEAGEAFSRDVGCFAANVREDRAGLASMEAHTELDADFRASQIAAFKAAIVEDERQRRASALNSAAAFASGGTIDHVRELLDIAALEPSFADQIATLKAYLDERAAEDAAPASPSSGAHTRAPIQ
jgi:tetratricopeptide (TPR) repeat protein